MSHHLHSTVLTTYKSPSGSNRRTALEALLYNHSHIVAEVQVPERDLVAYVLRTTVDDDVTAERLLYLAEYQCGRLHSGLYGAEVVGEYAQALVHAAGLAGIRVLA